MRPDKAVLLSAFLISSSVQTVSVAQDELAQANWRASSGEYWKSTSGACWRTSYWTPVLANPACDPELFKKVEVIIPRVAEAPPQPPAPPSLAPAPSAQPPSPPPPPPKTTTKRVTFSSEEFFDFDKATLRDQGKKKLDQFAAQLTGTRYNTIKITGHADRIGSKEYNQNLSMRRAESVKNYLVGKGIPADRISAEGKGETEPLTAPSACKGPVSREVIACLQLNRRVEVDVSGIEEVVIKTQ